MPGNELFFKFAEAIDEWSALEGLRAAGARQVDGEDGADSHFAAYLDPPAVSVDDAQYIDIADGRTDQSRGVLCLTARRAASSRLRTCSFPSTFVI